jgi:selenide,water dikinase
VNDELAVVQTIDFITPVVNDPYDFGQVAAANALSDLYAVGATPVFALNLVGFPVRSLPLAHMEQIMLGGAAKVAEAGAVIAGGHSIEDYAPKYGLAATGVVHPDRLITKGGGRDGDVLFLTKPLGSGIITTALDQGLTDPELEARIVALMTALNQGASQAMVKVGATACTDVTGFGLLGHLHEMAKASGLAATVDFSRVPVMPEALPLAHKAISNGTRNNHRYVAEFTQWSQAITDAQQLILADAQTSGGLLLAVPAEKRMAMAKALKAARCLCFQEIGYLTKGEPGHLRVQGDAAR